jgi:hypothetical protein
VNPHIPQVALKPLISTFGVAILLPFLPSVLRCGSDGGIDPPKEPEHSDETEIDLRASPA